MSSRYGQNHRKRKFRNDIADDVACEDDGKWKKFKFESNDKKKDGRQLQSQRNLNLQSQFGDAWFNRHVRKKEMEEARIIEYIKNKIDLDMGAMLEEMEFTFKQFMSMDRSDLIDLFPEPKLLFKRKQILSYLETLKSGSSKTAVPNQTGEALLSSSKVSSIRKLIFKPETPEFLIYTSIELDKVRNDDHIEDDLRCKLIRCTVENMICACNSLSVPREPSTQELLDVAAFLIKEYPALSDKNSDKSQPKHLSVFKYLQKCLGNQLRYRKRNKEKKERKKKALSTKKATNDKSNDQTTPECDPQYEDKETEEVSAGETDVDEAIDSQPTAIPSPVGKKTSGGRPLDVQNGRWDVQRTSAQRTKCHDFRPSHWDVRRTSLLDVL